MSYSKTTWKTGDTITAQLLNHAEDGIAANDVAIASALDALQIKLTYEDNAYTADKTYAEILAAFNAGKPCFVVTDLGDDVAINVGLINGSYIDEDDKILTMTSISFLGTTNEVSLTAVKFAPSGITGEFGTIAYTTE